MDEEIVIHNEDILSTNKEQIDESLSEHETEIINDNPESHSIDIKILHVSPFIYNGRIVKHLDEIQYDETSKSQSKPEIKTKSVSDFEMNVISKALKNYSFR
jgi:hypothetical protein